MIVDTTYGPVRGATHGALRVFGGVPFAEAPRGALRFARPRPPRPWTVPLDCTSPAAAAPHRASELGKAIGLATDHQSEDCLTVTVWTPATAPGAALPVMVWIHGGGFEGGSAANPLADGGELASRGEVVVVSVQYRLGVLGFLHLEGAPGNRGLLDQVAALEWVRANVSRFGGDPAQVTVFGSSAGGISVAMLLAMPRARGLFRRAIVQSGNAECVHPLADAQAIASEMLGELGLGGLAPGAARARLEAMEIEALCDDQRAASARLAKERAGLVFQPVLDPETFPDHPLACIGRGSADGVALLVGTNQDETKLAALEALDFGGVGDDELARRCRAMLDVPEGAPPLHAHVIRAYRAMPAHEGRSNKDLWDAISTDYHFRYPAIRLADAHARREPSTFMYMVTLASGAFDGALGACHAIEIPLVFGTHAVPPMDLFLAETPDLAGASRRVQNAWIAFARSGDPSTREAAAARWERGRPGALLLGRDARRVEAAFTEEIALWEPIFRELRAVPGHDDPSAAPPLARASSSIPAPM